MRLLLFIIFISYFGTICSQITKEQSKEFKIITDMLDSSKKVSTIRYKMKSIERVENGYSSSTSRIKLQMSPRKSYFHNVIKKIEILYNPEEIGPKCLVKQSSFPFFTVSLDPRGNLIRKNQHFTILELGFEFTSKTIAIAISKEKEQIAKHLTLAGKVEKNGMQCYMLIYENNSFSYYDYTVKEKETVSSIASKLVVNDYMLRNKNGLQNDYGYLKAGTTIKVPTFYCKKGIFYIDEKTMLPISVSIYDEVGLFECYDYYEVEINKPIPNAEFQRNYSSYGF